MGSESGYSSQTGVGNVFFGNKSGYSNTNGHQNVFLGYGAGFHNTIGQRNTYLGYGATGNPAVENATAIGSEAKVTANNSIVLGHKANVGIGVSAPSFQLHLSTDAAAKAGSPDWIVASDSRSKRTLPILPMASNCSNGFAQSGFSTMAKQVLKPVIRSS